MKYRFMHLRRRREPTIHCDEETVDEESNPVAMVFLAVGVFQPIVQAKNNLVAEDAAEEDGKVAELHQVEGNRVVFLVSQHYGEPVHDEKHNKEEQNRHERSHDPNRRLQLREKHREEVEQLGEEAGVLVRPVEKTVSLKKEDGGVQHRQDDVRLTHGDCQSSKHGAAENVGELVSTLAEE